MSIKLDNTTHTITAIREEHIDVKINNEVVAELLSSGKIPVDIMIAGIRSRLKAEWDLHKKDYIRNGVWFRDDGARWDEELRKATESEKELLAIIDELEMAIMKKTIRGD